MVAAKPGKDVTPGINWADIDNLADARAALESVVDASAVFGDGSEFLDNKDVLVGSPFLVLDWRFITDEKTEREYVNVLIMGADGSKARFNDGGTGVYAQLKAVSAQVGVTGIQCKKGLRKSDYTTEVDGKKQAATTYYFAT